MQDPANQSYYINTPTNDECQHLCSTLAGGTVFIKEQVSRVHNFPKVTANTLQMPPTTAIRGRLNVPGTPVELAGDSVYYRVLQSMVSDGNSTLPNDDQSIVTLIGARTQLGQASPADLASGGSNRYQFAEREDKLIIYNYNGLSEWQHFNGLHMNEGNATLVNSSLNDKWTTQRQAKTKQAAQSRTSEAIVDPYQSVSGANSYSDYKDELAEPSRDYLYRDSRHVSHSDAILDMAVIEASGDDAQERGAVPLLITCGRDGKVKVWR